MLNIAYDSEDQLRRRLEDRRQAVIAIFRFVVETAVKTGAALPSADGFSACMKYGQLGFLFDYCRGGKAKVKICARNFRDLVFEAETADCREFVVMHFLEHSQGIISSKANDWRDELNELILTKREWLKERRCRSMDEAEACRFVHDFCKRLENANKSLFAVEIPALYAEAGRLQVKIVQ